MVDNIQEAFKNREIILPPQALTRCRINHEKLKQIRQGKGIDPGVLAFEIAMRKPRYLRIENGKTRTPEIAVVKTICDALSIELPMIMISPSKRERSSFLKTKTNPFGFDVGRFQSLMVSKGFTASSMSHRAQVPSIATTVDNILKRGAVPRKKKAEQLAQIMGVNVSDFYSEQPTAQPAAHPNKIVRKNLRDFRVRKVTRKLTRLEESYLTRIRQAMQNEDVNIKELSQEIGVTDNCLYAWHRNEPHYLRSKSIQKLERYFQKTGAPIVAPVFKKTQSKGGHFFEGFSKKERTWFWMMVWGMIGILTMMAVGLLRL